MVKPTTLRLVLSIALTRGWSLRHIDINNAFLHGPLPETIYMEQPSGFVDASQPHYVCQLHKTIYGQKQAPRAWFSKLSSKLLSYGFSASKADPSLFIMHSYKVSMFLLMYVDDMILTSSFATAADHLIQSLSRAFLLKDLGQLSYFLGIELDYSTNGIILNQRKYISDLLKK